MARPLTAILADLASDGVTDALEIELAALITTPERPIESISISDVDDTIQIVLEDGTYILLSYNP